MASTVAVQLNGVRARISHTTRNAGRDPDSVQLVAVSKNHGVTVIREALAEGQRVFGENKVQEGIEKFCVIRDECADISLHMIGALQTNKVTDVVKHFDVIQTLDRRKLAIKLSQEMQKQQKFLHCFIQVNTGVEIQKSGILPNDLDEFFAFCCNELMLDVQGLMCIPPAGKPPIDDFKFLARRASDLGLPSISMGMSGDYDMAISLGATHVRVGSAIFGPR